jgi:hypothetical protein
MWSPIKHVSAFKHTIRFWTEHCGARLNTKISNKLMEEKGVFISIIDGVVYAVWTGGQPSLYPIWMAV